MKNRYDSVNCPICDKPLSGGDVVVCPECGAPYHKECYLKQGHCIFTELHEKQEYWKPPIAEINEPEQSHDEALKCSRCGTVNPPNGIFCQVCGNQLGELNRDNAGNEINSPNTAQGGFGPFGGPGGMMPPGIPLNPYGSPFGGVAPDEEIDGLPAKDVAIFVNRNTHYFLPKFKEQVTTKRKIINWPAFIFVGFYYLYRKMYALGLMLVALEMVLSIPSLIITWETLQTAGTTMTSQPNAALYMAANICSLLMLVSRLVFGLFANSLYKKHVYKKIHSIKATVTDHDEYLGTLAKKGSVAVKLIFGIVGAYFIISMASFYISMFYTMF